MLNEAVWVMLGGTTIAGGWSIWSWKVRRKDQKADKVVSAAVQTVSIAQKSQENKIISDIETTKARVDKIEKEDMKVIEGRLSVLETAMIGFETMQKLLNDTLSTHLTPILEAEKQNTKDVSELQKELFEMKLEAKYKNNQSG